LIKIKKQIDSVWFWFFKFGTENTEPNRTEKTGKKLSQTKPKPSQTKKTEPNQKKPSQTEKTKPNQFESVFILKNQTKTSQFEPVSVFL